MKTLFRFRKNEKQKVSGRTIEKYDKALRSVCFILHHKFLDEVEQIACNNDDQHLHGKCYYATENPHTSTASCNLDAWKLEIWSEVTQAFEVGIRKSIL